MASVFDHGDGDLWDVYMESKDQSEVTVRIHMSNAMAKRLVQRETDRVRGLNPDRVDIPEESVGSAVMNVLGLYASGSRI